MAMGGQLDMDAFPYDALSLSAPRSQQWGPRLGRILRELLPPKLRIRGPSASDFDNNPAALMRAQDEFKAASRQEKAEYEVWFKCVGSNKYAMLDEVARERGTWDGSCMEPVVRALARRGFRKPCKKYYEDSKGLVAHKKRRHPRPPLQTMREMRTANGRHNYGRKIFEIDKMYV